MFDITHRHDADWRWDPIGAPIPIRSRRKRYLDLGPVLPQLLALGARRHADRGEHRRLRARRATRSTSRRHRHERNTYTASYVEFGGALEVRLRRTIGLGVSGLTRQTDAHPTVEQRDSRHPEPDRSAAVASTSPDIGERGFTELGTTLRLSLGARRFSALVEVYGRRTRYALDYCAGSRLADGTPSRTACRRRDTGIPAQDLRGGGRVTIDAWIGSQLRLFASYELSSALEFQREITGFKSLRLMMEGVY